MRDHSCTLPIKLQQTNRKSTANNSNNDSTFFSSQQKAAAWAWHLRTGGSLLSSSSSSSSSLSLHARLKIAPSMSRFHAESIAASAAARNDDGDDDTKEEYKSPALFDALELASFALHLNRTLVCSSLRTHSMPHFPNPTSLSFSHSYDESEEERAGPKKARGRRWKQKLIDGIKKMAIPFR